MPDFLLFLTAEEKTIKERYAKKNEMDDFPEDQMDVLLEDSKLNKKVRTGLVEYFEPHMGRVNIMQIATDGSIETTTRELNNKFSPKVILVNHEKLLNVDTTCANLAIKYNMVYISAYQVIKHHITGNTEWGKRLVAGQTNKAVCDSLKVRDEF